MIRLFRNKKSMMAGVVVFGFLVGVALYAKLAPDSPARATATQEGFDAESFDGFPLLSLGASFEGLARTETIHKSIEPGSARASSESVTFIYGDCTITEGSESCAVPLQVTVLPACTPELPEWLQGETVQIRGVSGQHYGTPGHILLNLGAVKVIVISSAETNFEAIHQARRAAEALRGENALASAVTSNSSLAHLAELPSAGSTLCKGN